MPVYLSNASPPPAPAQSAHTGLHRVQVHVLARWDGRLMLLRAAGDDQWALPAGELGAAEPASLAACRILTEQVGLDATRMWPIGMQHTWTMRASQINLYFTPVMFRGFPVIMDRAQYEDLRWFDEPDLPLHTASHVRAAVDAFRKPESYREIGWAAQDTEPCG